MGYNLKAIKIEPIGGQLGINSSSSRPDIGSAYSISDLYKFVKTFDEEFSSTPVANAFLLNDDGSPRVVYHGTNAESEVLFQRKAKYITEEITYDKDGTPTIYLTEVAYEQGAITKREARGNVSGDNTGKSRPRTHSAQGEDHQVQRLSAQISKISEMQSLPERNTVKNTRRGELPEVRAEINGSEDSDIRYSISDGFHALNPSIKERRFVA